MAIEMDKIVNLCKRRGFIFQSSEIYGGQESCWDYGPLGAELKRNVKAAWWRDMVQRRPDMVGLDSSILMNPRVWKASGHLDNFSDPMVDCKKCNSRFRADHLPRPAQVFDNGHRRLDFDATEIHLAGKDLDWVAVGPIRITNLSPNSAQYDEVQLYEASNPNERLEAQNPGAAVEIKSHVPPYLFPGKEFHAAQKVDGAVMPLFESSYALFQLPRRWEGDLPDKDLILRIEFSSNHEKQLVTLRPKVQGVAPTCPKCGGALTAPRGFNLMFKTFMGPVEDSASVTYLRPETAQGIFVNFENVQQTMRKKLPFGIGQIGKSFRNEITPGNFTFRTREFEQMEIEYFVKPGADEVAHKMWLDVRMEWYSKYGMKKENLRLRAHEKSELAFYAKGCFDIEYAFPMGWSELEGIANRTDYDLKQHSLHSGKTLSYFEDDTKNHIVPYVIEPSAGADRGTLAFLIDAYEEQPVKEETRTVLHLHPALAPVKVAILPLKKNEQRIVDVAKGLAETLRRDHTVWYDDTGAIGKLYRRQDEIGTPFCVTIDFDTLDNGTATVRERDSMTQERIAVKEMPAYFAEKLKS